MHPTSDQGRSEAGVETGQLYETLLVAHDLLERLYWVHAELGRLAEETSTSDDPVRRQRVMRAWTALGPAVAACRATLPMVEFLKGELQQSAAGSEDLEESRNREGSEGPTEAD